MSISSVSSSLFNYATQSTKSPLQQFKSEFDQLGQDLSSGNLSAAQSDFSALQQIKPELMASGNSSPLAQAMNKLSQDLKSGDIAAAQQDFAKIQQFIDKHIAHLRHHLGFSEDSSAIQQLFQQLGQALKRGDLTSAQQAYASLQQLFQQSAVQTGTSAVQPQAATALSVSA
jgi:hypothetical protein